MSLSAESPGNRLYPSSPPMRYPHLSFLYRLECFISESELAVGAPYNAGFARSVFNINSGSFKGPRLEGEVLPGGADWLRVVKGTHAMLLDARYVVKTTDGELLYIQSKGQYRPGPGTAYSRADPTLPPPKTVTQDDVEFFSHLTIEAGAGKYNWLNGLVVIGVLTCVGERIIIDAYHLTNFPDREPESIVAAT